MSVLLFDFDSTLIREEGLDVLFQRSLGHAEDREDRVRVFRGLTDRGMSGEIPFEESFSARIRLLDADENLVGEVGRGLVSRITPSVERNRAFFRSWSAESADASRPSRIHIVSGGFGELIRPVAEYLGIPSENVHAHRFRYDRSGRILGADPTTALARGGKALAVRELGITASESWMVGDGATDLELRELGLVGTFVAFVENRHRPPVVQRADRVVSSMEELLALLGEHGRVPNSRFVPIPDSPADS